MREVTQDVMVEMIEALMNQLKLARSLTFLAMHDRTVELVEGDTRGSECWQRTRHSMSLGENEHADVEEGDLCAVGEEDARPLIGRGDESGRPELRAKAAKTDQVVLTVGQQDVLFESHFDHATVGAHEREINFEGVWRRDQAIGSRDLDTGVRLARAVNSVLHSAPAVDASS